MAVVRAVDRHNTGDDKDLDLLAQLLTEQDEAKSQLSEAGFGVIGTSWAKVVNEVKDAIFLGLRR